MSVCNKISTESSGACPGRREQKSFPNGNIDTQTNNNSTFIVTDPDSDIETDAAPDAPRPRGTPIPDPPNPKNLVNGEPLNSEEFPKQSTSFSKTNPRNGKIPGGFPKSRIPRTGATSVVYNFAQCNGVHVGSSYTYVIGPNAKQQRYCQENEEEVSPPVYEILMSSLRVVNDDHLDCVANNIGEKWTKLGKQLGLNDAAIYRFKQDYPDDHRERVYQLLLEWKQSIGGPNQAPLLSRLSAALWQIRGKDALDGLVKLENDPRLKSQ